MPATVKFRDGSVPGRLSSTNGWNGDAGARDRRDRVDRHRRRGDGEHGEQRKRGEQDAAGHEVLPESRERTHDARAPWCQKRSDCRNRPRRAALDAGARAAAARAARRSAPRPPPRPRTPAGPPGPRGRARRRAGGPAPRAPRGGRRASSPGGSSAMPLGHRERPVDGGAVRRRPRSRGPSPCASAASMIRPVRIRSSARPRPTTRGRRCVPPSISGTPQRRSGKPSCEPADAIRRSHHSASSRPPARHQPSIAAIVGLRRRQPGEAERALRRLEARGERGDRLQVGAGAEAHAAGAGDDQHARVVVGLEGAVGLQQPLGRRPVDGVAPRRAVDRQQRRRRRRARSAPRRSRSCGGPYAAGNDDAPGVRPRGVGARRVLASHRRPAAPRGRCEDPATSRTASGGRR